MNLLIAIALVFVVGLESGHGASYIPSARNGQCKDDWRGKFSSDGALGRNSTYRIGSHQRYHDFYRQVDRGNCWKEWLVVIYMAADNDLSPYSYRDVIEMEEVGSSVGVDVVVFLDTAEDDGLRYYHIGKRDKSWDYAPLLKDYQVKHPDETNLDELEKDFLTQNGPQLIGTEPAVTLPEGNSGDVKTAGAFLEWAFTEYPSRHVLLLGWSHGEGFDAGPNKTPLSHPDGKTGGFAFDFTSREKGEPNSHMAVTEMVSGLRGLLKKNRHGEPLDIVGSDACLNQEVEFGYEWEGVAEYGFGSSSIVQKKGFNYRTLLRWIEAHPSFTAAALAKQIPLLYRASVSPHSGSVFRSYLDPSATMASWTLSELKPLALALDELGARLTAWINTPKDKVDRNSRRGELNRLIRETGRFGGISQDLFNFTQRLGTWAMNYREQAKTKPAKDWWAATNDKVSNVRSMLDRAILEKYIGEAYRSKEGFATSRGVSIWLPNDAKEAKEMFPKFEQSRFYRQGEKKLTPWALFVQQLYPTKD
jgi:hypothetical protein